MLRGSVAAQPFVVWGEKDGGVVVANEALQWRGVVLSMLTEAFLQARYGFVQRVVLPQVGVGTVLPCARVDVGVVVAVGADDKRTCATW